MVRAVWQTAMIKLARSSRVKALMQRAPAASRLATRFVAGANPQKGVLCAEELAARHQIRSSLFYLGEYVDTPSLVEENVANKLAIAELLGQAGLDVHVSLDPTQVGLGLERNLARDNAVKIAEAVGDAAGNKPGVHCAMLDMEDQSVVDFTIALHDELRTAGLPTAITLQAYLRRTAEDLQVLIRAGGRVRLVNGAFAAGRDIAFTRRAEIKSNFRRLIDAMLSPQARDCGFYPIIATHDDMLHAHAIMRAQSNGWQPHEFEFEMLLGVRANLAEDLAQKGYRVRLYVPFGRDWWPYAVRRIGENPRNAWLLARSAAGALSAHTTR